MPVPWVTIDIETKPLSAAELERFCPVFEAGKNLKDPQKIEAAIMEKKAQWLADCALSPLTAEIFMLGVLQEGKASIFDPDTQFSFNTDSAMTKTGQKVPLIKPESNEPFLIREVFRLVASSGQGANYRLLTWNGASFDWPFIFRRALKHNIPIPEHLIRVEGRYIKYPPYLVDLRQHWCLGDQYMEGSLGTVARFLGVGDDLKAPDGSRIDGSKVGELWENPATHDLARAKLRNDLLNTAAVSERILGS